MTVKLIHKNQLKKTAKKIADGNINKSISNALKLSSFIIGGYNVINIKREPDGYVKGAINHIARSRVNAHSAHSYALRCAEREIVLNYPAHVIDGRRDENSPKYNGYEPKQLMKILGVDINHKEASPERLNEYRQRYDDYFREIYEKQDRAVIDYSLNLSVNDKALFAALVLADEAYKQIIFRQRVTELAPVHLSRLLRAGIPLAPATELSCISYTMPYSEVNFRYEKTMVIEEFEFLKSGEKHKSDKELLMIMGFNPERLVKE